VEQKLQQSKEIVRLVDIGVFEEVQDSSEWAFCSQSFSILKKNVIATIRIIADFRKLNLLLKHAMSPISYYKDWETDMIRSMKGFTFASSLDLNMGYYHIKLDADAQELCTIVFPWNPGNTNTNTNA
jgi:hypothetical protein